MCGDRIIQSAARPTPGELNDEQSGMPSRLRRLRDTVIVEWRPLLYVYLAASLAGHLAWEVVQLPFYTIFWEEPAAKLIYATVHCTAGDMLIAAATLAICTIMVELVHVPSHRRWPAIAGATIALGMGYTIFSEWLNTSRGTWAYTVEMPLVPLLHVGLTPVLQWILVPIVSFWISVRRSARTFSGEPQGGTP